MREDQRNKQTNNMKCDLACQKREALTYDGNFQLNTYSIIVEGKYDM